MKVKSNIDNTRHAIFCEGCDDFHIIDNRWDFNHDYENPTFAPSLLVETLNTRCHSFITNGQIQFLSDCTHKLANQTIELKEFPYELYFSGDIKEGDNNEC